MGLLDFTPEQADSLLNFGTGLLAAGGPSRTPVSFGQAFAGGIGNMQQQEQVNLRQQALKQEMDHRNFQMQTQKEEMEREKLRREQRLRVMAEILPTLPQSLQTAYQMGVPPEKIFEAWQGQKDAEEFKALIGGAPQPVARPYQAEMTETLANPSAGRLVADTPEQRAGIQRNYELMVKKYPQEAERLREQLIQQGIIMPPQPQQVRPSPESIGAYGASRAVSGRKGGDEILKYATLIQPNVGILDNGNNQMMYDKNSGGFIGGPVQKGMSPDAVAANQLGWANNDVARFNASKPTYHDGALVGPDGSITKTPMYNPPKGSKEATRQASAKVLPLIEEAKKLLSGSTGSYVGAGVDAAAGAVGISTKGAQYAAKLKALEGSLMMAQPRMEGPQSDKDSALYRQMAGQIGDSTVPVETRMAALEGIQAMHEKYADVNPEPQSTISGGGWSATVVK